MNSTINLTCQTTSVIALAFESIWVHTYDDVIIDKIAGQIVGTFSVLSIPFCTLKDSGNYSCYWFNKTAKYFAQTTVHVRSKYVFKKE